MGLVLEEKAAWGVWFLKRRDHGWVLAHEEKGA